MTRKFALVATAIAALSAPLAAQADDATQAVNINGNVEQACLIGQPSETTLELGDLTGTDGRITTALASAATAASVLIETAWCNGPGTLSLDASPLKLTVFPSYGTPNGFARFVTYDAKLNGWTEAMEVRPLVGDQPVSKGADAAYANELTLNISRLAPLNADGTAAGVGTEVLEAGSYSGSITVSVAVN